MKENIEAHMTYCSKIKDKPNLIDHISEHDGTRRSLQACHIIKKFNPSDAKDFAKIIFDNNSTKNWWSWHLPRFWKDKDIVSFCKKESKTSCDGYYSGKPDKHRLSDGDFQLRNVWYMERCVASTDEIDLPADVWKLSPNIQRNYPTVTTWGERFKNSSINLGWDENEPFQGWHDFKHDAENELRRLYKD